MIFSASPSYQATWPRSSADRRIDDVPTTSAYQPSAPLLNQIDEPSHYSSTTALMPSESLPAATTAYHYDQGKSCFAEVVSLNSFSFQSR